jgi:hypothetical protein
MIRALAKLPCLGRLRALHIALGGAVPLPGRELAALAGSPYLADLASLSLLEWQFPDGLSALWRDGPLKGLRRLEIIGSQGIGSNPAHNPHLKDLGDGSGLERLERFSFRTGPCAGDPAVAVARAERWTGLRELKLWTGKIGDAGARALAQARHLASLEVLDLSHNRIGDDGVAALAGSACLPRLRRLILDGNPASPERVAAAQARVGR